MKDKNDEVGDDSLQIREFVNPHVCFSNTPLVFEIRMARSIYDSVLGLCLCVDRNKKNTNRRRERE